MDLRYIEFAATKFFEMCREHPEICPHDYRLRLTYTNTDGKCVEYYKCSICGNEYEQIKD